MDYPTTYSAIIAQTRLAKIANVIYHEFLSTRTAGYRIDYKQAELMERDLVNWRKSLPSYFTASNVPSWFQGPRSVVVWKEQNLRILLWRGSQKYHNFLPTKVSGEDKCLDVAMQSVHDIATFCTTHEEALHQSLIWYATYCLFQATLVLVASSLKNTQEQLEQDESPCRYSISRAQECLKLLSTRNRSASRCLHMLDRIRSRSQGLPLMNLETDANSHWPLDHGFQETIPEMAGTMQELQYQEDTPTGNDWASVGGNQLAFNDELVDPNLRMLVDEMPFEFMDSMPLDILLQDWVQ